MKYPSKIAAILVVAVLGLGGLGAVTLAVAGQGHEGWSGKPHGKPMCQRGGPDKGGMGQWHGHHGPDMAEKLSVMETMIGIRANQIDAWRDFTDALLAMMKRPGGPGMMPPPDGEPFSLAEYFADRSIARAENAEKLKTAIATLRTTLTSEQLDKVKMIETRIRSRFAGHGPHGKWMGHGDGPHAMDSDSGPDNDTMDEPDSNESDDDVE